MASSGMLHRVAVVRDDVSEEPSASFIRVTRIGEPGTTLAATSNRRRLRRNFLKQRHRSSVLCAIRVTVEAVFSVWCVLMLYRKKLLW
jgi:hypothetical protein